MSRNISKNTPLSDYVHKEIKNSLEEIFGVFDYRIINSNVDREQMLENKTIKAL